MRIVRGSNLSDIDVRWFLSKINRSLRTKTPKEYLGEKDGITLLHIPVSIRPEVVESFVFLVENRVIGFLYMFVENDGAQVGAIWIEESYRGKGLGVVLYLAAIRAYGTISSNEDIGIMAVKTWRKLSKYHPVGLYHYKIPKKYRWNTYGIPEVNGIPITDLPDEYTFVCNRG